MGEQGLRNLTPLYDIGQEVYEYMEKKFCPTTMTLLVYQTDVMDVDWKLYRRPNDHYAAYPYSPVEKVLGVMRHMKVDWYVAKLEGLRSY